MFLRQRSTQAESFDAPQRSLAEVAESYRHLARINRVFFFSHPFVLVLPRLLDERACRSLSLLDVGAGDGSLGITLNRWAARRGWDWQVTNLDKNPLALELNPAGRNVVASALALPFPDDHFDVVIASQMTHHLRSEAEVIAHFREARRVARQAVVLSDVHRNALLLAVVWIWLRALRVPATLREDGLVSIRRGFRVPEWLALARAAGIADAHVWLYMGSRVLLETLKRPHAG
ncbi:MAG TPA: methyltransferase domain-containing protein [Verrucomicrobiae bacterium]